MPKGTCDHAGDPRGYNSITLTKGNGDVTVDVHWTWDGVSVFPDCAGTVIQVHYTNTGLQTWYAHLPHKAHGTTVVEIPPGTDQTVDKANTLRQAGLDTLDAISALTLTLSP